MGTTRVIITVPPRPQYGNAYYVLQRKFESGSHVLEVDEKQLAELQAELAVGVIGVTTEEEFLSASAVATKDEPKTHAAPAEEPKGPGRPMKR